jgi:hypothetical protein
MRLRDFQRDCHSYARPPLHHSFSMSIAGEDRYLPGRVETCRRHPRDNTSKGEDCSCVARWQAEWLLVLQRNTSLWPQVGHGVFKGVMKHRKVPGEGEGGRGYSDGVARQYSLGRGFRVDFVLSGFWEIDEEWWGSKNTLINDFDLRNRYIIWITAKFDGCLRP